MKISTKGALRLSYCTVLDLAEHRDCGFVALKDIARPPEFIEKIPGADHSHPEPPNILLANRGPQEAICWPVSRLLYRRSTFPDHASSLSPVPCIDQDPKLCGRSGECITLPVWEGLAQVINTYLDSITLEDILNGDYKKCQTHP